MWVRCGLKLLYSQLPDDGRTSPTDGKTIPDGADKDGEFQHRHGCVVLSLYNMSLLLACSSQESVSQAHPECQGVAAANFAKSIAGFLSPVEGDSSTTFDVSNCARRIHNMPDEMRAENR